MALKGRGPVEYLRRERKARMIEAFLMDGLGGEISGYTILDVGCGNGQISEYFGQRNSVYGVDVEDKRDKENMRFEFVKIENEKLPFKADYFDIVISHHVIEHVADQTIHLKEIARVLKKSGTAYLGCPNKGSPFMAGHKGNDFVPNWRDITTLFERANFAYKEYYTDLLKYPNKYFCEIKIGSFVPLFFLRLFRGWYPGHCFLLKHKK